MNATKAETLQHRHVKQTAFPLFLNNLGTDIFFNTRLPIFDLFPPSIL
jgi:hypothetical protein